MSTSEDSVWDGRCPSQLNIILLGGRNSGKSSVGNLILGREEFVTKERTSCSPRVGVVKGQWLKVVDTPGWWCDFSAQDTPELVKREIVSSVSLCPPGPHVVFIVIKASSDFCERRRRAVEEHVGLLGDSVWNHCMVVFTCADRSEHIEAEALVQAGGQALSWLRDKCSQRCHSVILNDDDEITKLLEKVQKFVAENGSSVFEMQDEFLLAASETRRIMEERAWQRLTRVRNQRSMVKEKLRPLSDIRIVLMGAKGSGKTSSLNTILGRENNQPLNRTAKSWSGTALVFGRQVTVVDTPGWWMNFFSDETPVFDRREMVLSLSLCPPGPHVFLLVIRVDRAFTETYRRAVQNHLQMIDRHIWRRVMVLFSFGDWLGSTTTEQLIESEGEPLQWLLERCHNRYHVLNNKTKGDGFQVRELIGKIEEILAGCKKFQHCEIEGRMRQQLEGRRRREEEEAKDRLKRKTKQRQMARSQMEQLNPLSELKLVLVGGRKTGKSSCGNTILDGQSFQTEMETTSCSEKQAIINDKTVAVLDTPGCFSVTSDLLESSYTVLLVVNMSASFKDTHMEAIEKQLEAAGDQMWSRAVVLFSHGDWLGDTSVEQRIESEGEPLRSLLERCGNRYHVLDNKHRGHGAQVQELIQLVDEMLAEERLAALHRGESHMWKSVSAAGQQQQQQQEEAVKLCEEDLTSCRHQLAQELPASACPTLQMSPNNEADLMLALPAGRSGAQSRLLLRNDFTSCLASLLSGKAGLRWTVNLPDWFSTDEIHLRHNGESQVHLFSSRPPKLLLTLPQTQRRTRVVENVFSMNPLCHPALSMRTLRRFTESGLSLQALIDQWDPNSSLEDLEAFIDSYFEMLWERTMESFHPQEPEQETAEGGIDTGQEEVLSSIDRKLSKLELLEEIREDLSELRKSLEELKEKSKQDDDSRVHVDAGESKME